MRFGILLFLILSSCTLGSAAHANSLVTGSEQAMKTMADLARVTDEQRSALDQAYQTVDTNMGASTSTFINGLLACLLAFPLFLIGVFLSSKIQNKVSHSILFIVFLSVFLIGMYKSVSSLNSATDTTIDTFSVPSRNRAVYQPLIKPICERLAGYVSNGEVSAFTTKGWEAAVACAPTLVAPSRAAASRIRIDERQESNGRWSHTAYDWHERS